MKRLKCFFYLSPFLFMVGCASTSTPNSAKSLSEISLQQTAGDCKIETNNIFHMISQSQSGMYRGSLKRDITGICLNSK